MKLSAVIIAKNNQEQIADAIRSVEFCNEVLVVDGGSTDKTTEIAKKLGAIVIKGESGNFAKQREIGLKAAKGEWVLYIDTDERVSTSLRENIQTVILGSKATPESRKDPGQARMTTASAYRIKRQNFYLGNHPWPKIEQLERLFNKKNLKKWVGTLHESPIVEGEIGDLDGLLYHYTHRDLTSMLNKTIVWSDVEAKLRFDTHHPKMTWWRFFRVLVTGFWDSYIGQGGWRVGTVGLIESIYQAYSLFITYAKLWEMQNQEKIQDSRLKM